MNYGLRVIGGTRHRPSSSIALVQSNAGGYQIGFSGSATSSAAGFSSNTTSGNLLVCIVWATSSNSTNPTIDTPVTSGFTWTQAVAKSGVELGCSIFYIANASQMTTAKTTTVEVTGSGTVQVEFSLYEFSGLTSGVSVDTTESNDGTSTAPSTTNLSTSATDLIICACEATSSAGTHKLGYTAGIASSSLNYGVAEYILNQVSGSIATGFGGTQTDWVCVAVAFKP